MAVWNFLFLNCFFFKFFFKFKIFFFYFFEYSSKLFPAVFFVPMWTENLCGANLSYYEMCERNVKVWIPFIPWDSQLCILWLTQTKKITNLKLFDMCIIRTKLSTKITNKILNKIKIFPTYLMGFFGAWNPQQEYFKTGLMLACTNQTWVCVCLFIVYLPVQKQHYPLIVGHGGHHTRFTFDHVLTFSSRPVGPIIASIRTRMTWRNMNGCSQKQRKTSTNSHYNIR